MKDASKNEVNEFIEPIYNKSKSHDFSAWRLLKKTLKRMDKISPDFDTLYKIWEMVNMLYTCYMHTYTETSKLHLFLGTVPKGWDKDHTFSMIYREDNFTIKIVLQLGLESKYINIEINRNIDSRNSKPETISFEDGCYEYQDKYDEQKFLFIVSCIMNGTKELMKYYYKNKRF